MEKYIDILTIAETKMENTFNNNLFITDYYKMERRDRNRHGGGLMVFTRSSLPIRRRKDLECKTVETICFELNLNKRKWGILCTYRQPSMNDTPFENEITATLNKMFVNFENTLLLVWRPEL